MTDTTDPGCFPSTAIGRGPYTPSSTLPLGRWHVMANGRIHFLDITSVSSGVVEGIYNGDPIPGGGHWDATNRTLTFFRFIPDVGVSAPLLQRFTGYLMHYQAWDDKWRMAGEIVQISPEVRVKQGGWYATLSRKEVVSEPVGPTE